MKTLITPESVFRLAFSRDELLSPSVVMPSDIVAVEERHIRPVVGEALYSALAEGRYADLMEEYVAPPSLPGCATPFNLYSATVAHRAW